MKPLFGRTAVKAGAPAKLGSEEDPIRQMLFASQTLAEQVELLRLKGSTGPLQAVDEAHDLVKTNHVDAAIARLQEALQSPGLESRVILWLWSALRELGVQPNPGVAFEVLGVVAEVPSGGAYDTLAAYVDGRARYLNFSGRAIFWDSDEVTVKARCRAFVNASIPAAGAAQARTSLALPQGGAQVTLLTRSGLYAFSNPPEPVIQTGAALMIELINRSEGKTS